MRVGLGLSLLLAVTAVAVGQMTFSGTWSSAVHLLPTVGIETELTLHGQFQGWKLGGTAEYYSVDGYVWQTFDIGGGFGPLDVEWTLLFGPLAPAYLYSLGTAKLTFGGLDFTFYAAHLGPDVPGYVFTGGPTGGGVAVVELPLDATKLRLEIGFGARLAEFTITYVGVGTYTKAFPVDPFPGGLQFTYLKLGTTKLPLCCGVTFDADFSFTKAGFDALTLTLRSIPICCGISFDAAITYTTTQKSVELRPRWAGVEGCFTVYGDPRLTGFAWDGIEIHGFKVRCEIAACHYLELLTAFNVAQIEAILNEDIFQGPEFEYVKLGFCGPGCCGGKYTVTFTAFFQPMGSLFGLRRLQTEAAIPLMANLTLRMTLGVTVGGPASLALGWTFTF